MSWLGPKAPGANGNNKQFSQAELNNATTRLQNALSRIANQHVRRYAKEIKNAAIAKARNGYVPQANLNRLKAAEAAAKAALKPVPTATIETQTNVSAKNAELAVARNAAAFATFNRRIAEATNTSQLRQVGSNVKVYATKYGIPLNRSNIKWRLRAINVRAPFVPIKNS